MSKVWRFIALLCAFLLVVSLILMGVAYATGGSVNRLMATTDITDMTKFVSRETLSMYVERVFTVFNDLFGWIHR